MKDEVGAAERRREGRQIERVALDEREPGQGEGAIEKARLPG